MKTDINQQSNCDAIRELIFEMAESDQWFDPPADHVAKTRLEQHLKQHIDSCATCRKLFDEEMRLTEILCGHQQPTSSFSLPQQSTWLSNTPNQSNDFTQNADPIVPPVLVYGGPVVLAVLLLIGTGLYFSLQRAPITPPIGNDHAHLELYPLPSTTSLAGQTLGSIIERSVITNVSHAVSSEALANTNHIELPAGATASIELNDTGTIEAIGPAVFEIDRIGNRWKVSMLTGQVRIAVSAEREIQVSGRRGTSGLTEGLYRVSFDSSVRALRSVANRESNERPATQETEQDPDVSELLERGLSVFQSDSDESELITMEESADLLGKVLEHPSADGTQRYSASFYRIAALANSNQHEEVLNAAKQWQTLAGEEQNELVMFMVAEANWALGNKVEARQSWEQLLESYPESVFKAMIQSYLGQPIDADNAAAGTPGVPRFAPQRQPPYTTPEESKAFMAGQNNGYLVVTVGLEKTNAEHEQFRRVAERAREFHHAALIDFDGADFEALQEEIRKQQPANVLFVIPPQLLDVNFHRELFKLAPTLDNDLFMDFAWGYLTARDGTAVEKFWNRIEQLHRNGMANNVWLETAVLGGESKSTIIDGSIPQEATAAGFQGKQIYFGCAEADPEVLTFIDNNLSELENASVIAMTGNGDPQGIWLFDDSRNSSPDKHWKFDKDKVGQDPENAMTRLRADRFRSLSLQSPVIWSGTCHSGACFRVYVEGDIVSTFGTSDETEVYDLEPDESMCLALIDAGAGALLVPVASNHGMAVSMETRFAFGQGATLGEAVQSTYNDVLLQAGGVPQLVTARQGDSPKYFSEPIMQGGGANRILIGDPALAVFRKTEIPNERTSFEFDEADGRLRIKLNWTEGFHPHAWNLYADGRDPNRMKARIDVTDVPGIAKAASINPLPVTVTMRDADDKEINCAPRAEIEVSSGRYYLHVEATCNESRLSSEVYSAVFEIEF